MRTRLMMLLTLTVFFVSACNLGGSPEQPEEDLTDPVETGRPQVTILSPNDGDTFTVNEQILVSVSATDSIGVTRVQLLANGNVVKTVSSEFADGEVSYEGILDYTPRTEGDYILTVIAYRDAISSETDQVTVSVGDEEVIITERPGGSTTTGSSTGNTGNPVPVIPNDGVCRVLTLVGLNFRTQPTTTRDNVITTFGQNTLLVVVARLADNSWWKVSSSAGVGWVSGNPQFVSLSGNCAVVPVETVILNTPTPRPPTSTPLPTQTPLPTNTPEPGVPDLTVPSIDIDEEIVIPSGESEVTVEVTITIRNAGNGESGQFDVILTVEGASDDVVYDVATSGSLNPGQFVTFTVDVTFDAVGEYDIQVDVDPEDEVEESGEFNNRADTTVEVVNES